MIANVSLDLFSSLASIVNSEYFDDIFDRVIWTSFFIDSSIFESITNRISLFENSFKLFSLRISVPTKTG